jgi:hypothetical protein
MEDSMAENEQVVDPVEQEVVPFHEHEIIAVRLADGRICVVLRWVCETLQLDSQGQVRRIERTASTARELVRVRVQPRVAGSKGGGVQTMPALTLRGFSPWILGINPDEVKSDDPTEEARIRELIVAYQEEAKDVLYLHFLNKGRPVLPEQPGAAMHPLAPPGPEAGHEEQATYHETMSLWHRWQADRHMQAWRKEMQLQQGTVVEEGKTMGNLLSTIQERLGPLRITIGHQGLVRFYVAKLSEALHKPHGTIFGMLHTDFRVPRYQELSESDWYRIEQWFRIQFPGQKLPEAPTQSELF